MEKIAMIVFWFLPVTLYYLEYEKGAYKRCLGAHSQTEKDIDRLFSLTSAFVGVIFILTLIF